MQIGNLLATLEYDLVTQIAPLLLKLQQKLSEKCFLRQSAVIV